MDNVFVNPNATHLLIRHTEITLKGKNRPEFERRLMRNLSQHLQRKGLEEKPSVLSGRMVLPFHKEFSPLTNVAGVAAVAPCMVRPLGDAETVFHEAVQWVKEDLRLNPGKKTFGVRVRRINKRFETRSSALEVRVADEVLVANPHLGVDLKSPELEVVIEIRKSHVFYYGPESVGARGLPLDVSQRVVCLMSGGIDSPVAVQQVMLRGLSPVLVHFHSIPFTSSASIDKVKRLVQKLREFSPYRMELWLVPLLEIQTAVKENCHDRFRTIHYRRFMLKIAQEIARRRHAKALVTGDSISQVASQTLQNLVSVESGIELPVLRPLLTMDKATIVEKAKQIGTYETSLEPHEDTCVLFASAKPTTQANLQYLLAEESRLDPYQLVFSALDRAELVLL